MSTHPQEVTELARVDLADGAFAVVTDGETTQLVSTRQPEYNDTRTPLAMTRIEVESGERDELLTTLDHWRRVDAGEFVQARDGHVPLAVIRAAGGGWEDIPRRGLILEAAAYNRIVDREENISRNRRQVESIVRRGVGSLIPRTVPRTTEQSEAEVLSNWSFALHSLEVLTDDDLAEWVMSVAPAENVAEHETAATDMIEGNHHAFDLHIVDAGPFKCQLTGEQCEGPRVRLVPRGWVAEELAESDVLDVESTFTFSPAALLSIVVDAAIIEGVPA